MSNPALRLLFYAVETIGSVETTCEYLGCSTHEMLAWIEEDSDLPAPVIEKLVDLTLGGSALAAAKVPGDALPVRTLH